MAEVDQRFHLTVAPTGTLLEHPEVLAWFDEAKRLLAEAEERFESGRLLPALSSLAAVPPVHHMLIERCSSMLEDHDSADSDPRPGMYL